MQKPEPNMSFAHPESGPSRAQTGSFDILRQPSGAGHRAKPWCKTPIRAMVRKPMGKRTGENTGMYSHPDYKQGYEDATDGKPLPDISSSAYKAGWQARTDFAGLLTKAGWVERDGNWFPARDVPDDSE